ncbi:MAG: MarR family transcriptional regulator [Spirochaetales bacterium]|nr:MarR family transcriptional regulator [Spirochaetales bacterium]
MNIPDDTDLLKLDNQLCFALYVTSKEIIRQYKPLLDPLNLTYTGYIAMLALWERDNIPIKDLGTRLYLDSGTLTPLLKKLEKQGLLERVRDSRDERKVLISLTAEGKALKERAADVPRRLICDSRLDGEMVRELLTLLHGIMK